jgi:hypothetical protein
VLYIVFISLVVHLFSLARYAFIHRCISFIFALLLGSFHCAFSTDTTEHRTFTSKGSAFIFGHFAFTTDVCISIAEPFGFILGHCTHVTDHSAFALNHCASISEPQHFVTTTALAQNIAASDFGLAPPLLSPSVNAYLSSHHTGTLHTSSASCACDYQLPIDSHCTRMTEDSHYFSWEEMMSLAWL